LVESNVTHGRFNTIEGEALAMKEAISEAIQRGFTHVIFESDSQIFIDAISSGQQGHSTFSLLISNIRSLLSLVSNFEVKFVKRQTNMVAHTLARATYSRPRHCTFESIPSCIESYLHNEVS
jgi:ribonuclease HI